MNNLGLSFTILYLLLDFSVSSEPKKEDLKFGSDLPVKVFWYFLMSTKGVLYVYECFFANLEVTFPDDFFFNELHRLYVQSSSDLCMKLLYKVIMILAGFFRGGDPQSALFFHSHTNRKYTTYIATLPTLRVWYWICENLCSFFWTLFHVYCFHFPFFNCI